jgi:hypothetical protein
VPKFPPKPEDAGDDPHPWSLDKIWNIVPGGVPGRLWAGLDARRPVPLRRRRRVLVAGRDLWRMPERRKWGSVAGGGLPGISTVLVDPRNPADIRSASRPPACGRRPMPVRRGA